MFSHSAHSPLISPPKINSLLIKLTCRMCVPPPTSPSLPALDWQLPSSSGPYSLQIDVQPKSHHRAHYETEGSRGAVKAPAGGHPVIQVCSTASFPLSLNG